MKIGLLVNATGKYIYFTYLLWESVQKYFFKIPNVQVEMFIFTDSDEVPKGTKRIFQEHKAFPYATLLRYHYYSNNKKILSDMDYLFYCDADMEFVAPVGEEILGELVGTIHPGFFERNRSDFSYEPNPKSKAFIPKNKGSHYFCGGFNGGTSKDFLLLCDKLKENIDKDLKNNIIAIHNDESHLNRYFVDHKPTKILDPSYCFPEELTEKFQSTKGKLSADPYTWFPKSLKKFATSPRLIAKYKNHEAFRYGRVEGSARRVVNETKRFAFLSLVAARSFPSRVKHVSSRVVFNISKDHPEIFTRNFYNIPFSKVFHLNCNVDLLEKNNNLLDLVTIGFNNSDVIETQIKLLNKNLTDKFFYTVADNSSSTKISKEIQNICAKYKVGYIKLPPNFFSDKGLGNLSHGSAMTWVFKNYIKKRNPRYFGFLDHDMFPIKKTSLVKYFKASPVIGFKQPRENYWYLWAGFCFFDMEFVGKRNLDFLSKKYGNQRLDTGGANWEKIYCDVDADKLPSFKHRYLNLTGGEIAQHDMVEFYGDWLHLFNASNWYAMDDLKFEKRSKALKKLIHKYVT